MKPSLPVLLGMSETSAMSSFPGSFHSGLAAEDMIDFYKVMPCPRSCNHDWATCFYAHPNEKARRRSLAEHWYSAIFCVDMLHKSDCKHGDKCNLAHSVFEYWMHPDKFRTKYCKDGADCKRTVCFFAHSPQELRQPGDYTPRSPIQGSSCSSSPTFVLPFNTGNSSSSLGSGANSSALVSPTTLLSPTGYSGTAAAGPGAACFTAGLQFGNGFTNSLAANDTAAAAANTMSVQQQIATMFLQQHSASDTVNAADATSAQLQHLQDAAAHQAAAQLAHLKVEYECALREAEVAAVKAAEASHQLASALGPNHATTAAAGAAGNFSPLPAGGRNSFSMPSPHSMGASQMLLLQQQHQNGAFGLNSLAPATPAAGRTPGNASRLLQLEAAQATLPGLAGYSPAASSTASTAAVETNGLSALLNGGLQSYGASRLPSINLDSQLMSLSFSNANNPDAAGLLPKASSTLPAAAANSAQLSAPSPMQSSRAWHGGPGGGLTLAGFLGLGASDNMGARSGSSSPTVGHRALLPGEQVMPASALLASHQQHPQGTSLAW